MRILVVEDEPVLGKALAAALRSALDADVDLAADGSTALRHATHACYDLAVVDYWLPPPTGVELLERWNDRERVDKILMMSGAYDGPEPLSALGSGADAYLEKPFPLSELIAVARSLLDDRKHERREGPGS